METFKTALKCAISGAAIGLAAFCIVLPATGVLAHSLIFSVVASFFGALLPIMND